MRDPEAHNAAIATQLQHLDEAYAAQVLYVEI